MSASRSAWRPPRRSSPLGTDEANPPVPGRGFRHTGPEMVGPKSLSGPPVGRDHCAMRTRTLMLTLATIGFAVNFWAWALLSPLAPRFKEALHLSPFQQALLVAVPVVVGSVGRIPVGALTDRYGGRLMFPIVSALTILPVL